jgi:3-oxoacyl-[acyl-carrier-protein] synthase III
MALPLPIGIFGIEYYLPEKVYTSEQIAAMSGLEQNTMERKLGIRQLHLAGENECASDLAVAAAEKLFCATGFPREKIDGLILITQNPDYKLPTTACIVQDRLHLSTDCMAFDINQGCSAFPYGLAVGGSMIHAGIRENILLITSETYSKVVSPKDKTVCGLFGDAAAATLVRRSPRGGILSFHFGTDGSGYDRLIVPAGGARQPSNEQTRLMRTEEDGNSRSLDHIRMHGRDIFEFMDRVVPKSVEAALALAGVALDQVKMFVFHQANTFMLEFLIRRMKLPPDRAIVYMAETGNTVSASVPIALKEALRQNRISTGDIVVLCGFGVGLSWATAVLEWCDRFDWPERTQDRPA